MVKLMQCIRRRKGTSPVEFRAAWREYGEVVRQIGPRLGAQRCTLSTALLIEQNAVVEHARGAAEAFDGVAEMWFEDAPGMVAALRTPDGMSLLAEFWRFQERFVEVPESSFFFAAEEPVF